MLFFKKKQKLHNIYIFYSVCARVRCVLLCITWCARGGQRTTCRNQFCPSTLGAPGIARSPQTWQQAPLSLSPLACPLMPFNLVSGLRKDSFLPVPLPARDGRHLAQSTSGRVWPAGLGSAQGSGEGELKNLHLTRRDNVSLSLEMTG